MHPYGVDDQSSSHHASSITVADEAARHAGDVDRRARFPEESLRALGAAGLLGLTVPVELGGRGGGLRAFCAVAEELGRACASSAMVYVMHVSATQAIAAAASLGDRFVTNAAKSWVTSASHADSYVSSAQAPGAGSPLESTIYLARTTSDTIRPQGGFDGLGLRGNDSQPVSIEEHAVGKSDLLTAQGKGADLMLGVAARRAASVPARRTLSGYSVCAAGSNFHAVWIFERSANCTST
jgi:isovaleryl-CoA dehydrogenase